MRSVSDNGMEYRVENKYIITEKHIALIKGRLDGFLQRDSHQTGESYLIRSLYFDTYDEKCISENDAGVDDRKKYRIRTYGESDGFIRLEIKEKKNSLTKKSSCMITRAEAEALATRDCFSADLPHFGERRVLNEFLLERKCKGLLPRAVIEYERSAYVYKTGNVRITIDKNISASGNLDSFLLPKTESPVPVTPEGIHILEVKYDEFIPDFILQLLQIGTLERCTFSKYYLGCFALNGEFLI